MPDQYYNVEMEVELGDAVSKKVAEAWAVGKRGGVDVGTTDPTYHNNAKYYAQLADSESQDAEAWAKGTRNGTAVGSTDEAYQNNSEYFKGLAQTAANAAAQSVQDAQTAAGQASGYASAAEIAKAAAEAAVQEVLDAIVAAQGNDLVRMDENGDFYVLETVAEEETEESGE